MQSIQLIFDDAPENIQVPGSLRHHKVEVTFRALDVKNDNKSSTGFAMLKSNKKAIPNDFDASELLNNDRD